MLNFLFRDDMLQIMMCAIDWILFCRKDLSLGLQSHNLFNLLNRRMEIQEALYSIMTVLCHRIVSVLLIILFAPDIPCVRLV